MSTTGQLKIIANLVPLFDFEVEPAKTSYMVTVTVTDGKDAAGTVDETVVVDDEITVTIMVTDVNEAPEFDAETDHYYVLSA